MAKATVRGKFITFEGLDGCGKSTQMERLAAVLREHGIAVVTTREPGGTAIGERIRAVLLDSRTAWLDAHAEMALMFASRAQLIAEVIEPALEAGQWVLCDRFTDSTEAYQGGGRQLGTEAVLQLHRVLCRGLWPDLTILMDCDVGSSVGRARRRNKAAPEETPDENRFEKESHAFFTRVRNAFRAIAEREPQRVVLIDARPRLEIVHPQIVRVVFERLMDARNKKATPCINPMPFADFHGNAEVAHTLREMLALGHFPHAVILSGPQGSGKFTLSQMVAKAMNCLEQPLTDGLPDFCGHCANCVRIAEADALEERFAEAVEARESLRDADKRETRLFVQTHPDVLIIPPDPPQMLVKVDQIRHVIHEIYYKPVEGRERVYIFSDADFLKEAANSLLKILEEPPEFATLFLLTDNPAALLPTIRSRCMHLRLAPVAAAEVEHYLAGVRPEWKARERALVARVCGGGLGRARSFDLAAYVAARQDALALLAPTMGNADHSALFRVTDAYRAGIEGKAKTELLIRTLYSLLEDLLFLKSATPELVRNHDLQAELEKMASQVEFAWIVIATQRLGELESGMRRNLLRSLALDTFATSLER